MSNKNITWVQLAQWWPILGILVVITLSYATLITRITIIENKIDDLTKLIDKNQTTQTVIIDNLNDLNKRIVVVETEHTMNRR